MLLARTSGAAVKGSPRKPPGNVPCREERCSRRPRATEPAHLRAPATLAELTPRRANSAIGAYTYCDEQAFVQAAESAIGVGPSS
jgi:hypothetical protein